MILLRTSFFLLTIMLSAFNLKAQETKAGQECFPTKENKLVYDVANILNDADENQLNDFLAAFSDSTSNQIAVVIVPDLCGMEKSQFATELGEMWGVGQAKEDNGIIFLVKPKTMESNGQVFIAVGRGLEGAIPDITAKQIIDFDVIPSFKQNDYAQGISAGCQTLMELARGEYNSDAYAAKHKNGKKKSGKGVIILLALLLFAGVFASKVFQSRRYAQTNGIGFWAAWALLSAASRSHRGYYNNFSSGRGGFGGGGGGFGGFGGGGFGGGGAGGSW